ncbi:MAG: collagen-like triple helix repeat-containing protein [Bacteroidia bacterium]
MKKFAVAFLLIGIAVTSGCKKGDKGDTGPAGPTGSQGQAGPSAKTYTFTGTFDASITVAGYTGIIADFSTGNTVIVYALNNIYSGTNYYVQTPYVASGTVNIYAEVGDDGNVFVHTDKADGTAGSPWAATTPIDFKAVLIKSSFLKEHPNWDLSTYDKAKSLLNLRD